MRNAWIVLVFFPLYTQAACPKNKKEWLTVGPRMLIETAAKKVSAVIIPNFSEKLVAKKSVSKNKSKAQKADEAQANATPFQERKKDFVLVEASLPEEALSLSGVAHCDPETKEPQLLSLTWMKGEQSGLVKMRQ